MKFPRTQSPSGDAHADALERLDEARGEQQRLSEARGVAEEGAAAMHAANAADVAGQQVSAREAWARWATREE